MNLFFKVRKVQHIKKVQYLEHGRYPRSPRDHPNLLHLIVHYVLPSPSNSELPLPLLLTIALGTSHQKSFFQRKGL